MKFLVGSVVFILLICGVESARSKADLIQRISDPKEFKKFVRTHTNVLVVFAKSEKEIPLAEKDVLIEVAEIMKGVASVVFVDCSAGSKPCKKLKSSTQTYELKHFKDGDYHKMYDRQFSVKSIVKFLHDPTGDTPWDEEPTGKDVVHIESQAELMKLVQKEKRPILAMFYAPWCGHCKRLKPEFAAAASELKGTAVLAGMDVDNPEGAIVRTEFNITGFPTLIYFEHGTMKYRYGGENNKDGIVKWMQSPSPPVEPEQEPEWSETDTEIVHLTDATFDEFIATNSSVLVMFYAPWCGHCKKMKPEYELAAKQLKEEGIEGSLAAVDATKEETVSKRFDIKGFPTVKYFKDGEFKWDYTERTAAKIVNFMKDPSEPQPDLPPEDESWENVPSEVVHLSDEMFKQFVKKKKHVLVMFYAPWCGHCKLAKPQFTAAAEHFKDDSKVVFAAADCTKHSVLCKSQDVSGYPTFIYYNYGKNDIKYTGARQEADFVRFMKDPLSPLSLSPPKANPEELWNEVDIAKNIYHLTDLTFDTVIRQHKSALVLFYAPWCGHCKAMKPAYAEAAAILKESGVNCILAAVDASAEKTLQSRFSIKGFPTMKHFINGVEDSTYELGRTTQDFVNFMKSRSPLLGDDKTPTPLTEDKETVAGDLRRPTTDEL
jgi:protein disulfide-isomerase/protein disulfide isomerase family A protein 5